jgi:hypothetical protein
MIYVKSILAGLSAMVVFAVLGMASLIAWGYWIRHEFGADSWGVAVDFRAVMAVCIAGLVIFALAYYWKFRRAKT